MTKYSKDEYFRLNVKKFIALDVVPIDEVVTAFDLTVNRFGDNADDLLDYFAKRWMDERKRSDMFFFLSFSKPHTSSTVLELVERTRSLITNYEALMIVQLVQCLASTIWLKIGTMLLQVI